MVPKIFVRIILVVLLSLMAPGSLRAAATLTLNLDRDQASLSDSVRLSVSAEGSEGVDQPQIAGLEEFRVRSGGTTSQFQFINGKTSRSFSYTFYLQPTRTGAFTIGPARISVEGKTITSNTVRLKVTDQPAAGPAGAEGRGNLFLTAEVSPKEAYHEQQLIYTLKLFRRIKVSDISVTLPRTEGLTFRQIGEPRQYMSNVGGQNFDVLEVSYILTAVRPGTYTIEPARMPMTVYDQTRRVPHGFPEDMFFGLTQGRAVAVPSEPIKLIVRQLPQEGRPANFSGLVGSFKINATCDPVQLKAGDSASLSVQVTGQGNINRIPDLTLPEIPGLKVYADQSQLENGSGSQSNSGTKTMKWAIVPQRQGTYTIPALALSYFDTQSRGYKTLSTRSQTLTVLPGEVQSQPLKPPVAGTPDKARPKLEVEALGHDILPIHSAIEDRQPGLVIQHHKALAIILLLLPALACLAVFIALRLKNQSAAQSRASRARKASKIFVDTVSKETLSASQTLESVRIYINERFDLAIGLITPEEVRGILSDHRVNPDLAKRLHSVLVTLQHAVYTGHGDQSVSLGHDLVELILQIDKEAQ